MGRIGFLVHLFVLFSFCATSKAQETRAPDADSQQRTQAAGEQVVSQSQSGTPPSSNGGSSEQNTGKFCQ